MLVNDVKKFLHNSTNLKDVAFKVKTYIKMTFMLLYVQLKENFINASLTSTVTVKSIFEIKIFFTGSVILNINIV